MACESFDNFAQFEVPDDDLGILASTCNESIALADVDVCDEIKVSMQTSLEGERVTVPHLDNPIGKATRFG